MVHILKRPYSLVAMGAAVVILIGLVLWPRPESEQRRWAKVKRGTFYNYLLESGEVQAVNSRVVSAPREWRAELQIIDMVEEGTYVEAGDFLIQFDTGYLQAKYEQARDELLSQQAEMRKVLAEQSAQNAELESQLKLAEFSRDQAKLRLENLRFESEVKKEDARLALEKALISQIEAVSRIEAQKTLDANRRKTVGLKIDQAQAELAAVERKMHELRINAPIPGLVVYHRSKWQDRELRVGDKAQPGRPVIDIPDLSKMEVVVQVNEIDALSLSVGTKTEVRLTAFPERAYTAEVTSISRLADKPKSESNLRLFELHALIADVDSLLKPGMTASARITIGEWPDALMVPASTIFERDGNSVVFPEKRSLEPAKIEVLRRNDYWAMVSGELEQDDRIAWQPPTVTFAALGAGAYAELVAASIGPVKQHFDAMSERGLSFDYDAARTKPKPEVEMKPGPGDIEAMIKQQISEGKRPDPELLKQLMKQKGGKGGMMMKMGPGGAKGEIKMTVTDSSQAGKPGKKVTIRRGQGKGRRMGRPAGPGAGGRPK